MPFGCSFTVLQTDRWYDFVSYFSYLYSIWYVSHFMVVVMSFLSIICQHYIIYVVIHRVIAFHNCWVFGICFCHPSFLCFWGLTVIINAYLFPINVDRQLLGVVVRVFIHYYFAELRVLMCIYYPFACLCYLFMILISWISFFLF